MPVWLVCACVFSPAHTGGDKACSNKSTSPATALCGAHCVENIWRNNFNFSDESPCCLWVAVYCTIYAWWVVCWSVYVVFTCLCQVRVKFLFTGIPLTLSLCCTHTHTTHTYTHTDSRVWLCTACKEALVSRVMFCRQCSAAPVAWNAASADRAESGSRWFASCRRVSTRQTILAITSRLSWNFWYRFSSFHFSKVRDRSQNSRFSWIISMSFCYDVCCCR